MARFCWQINILRIICKPIINDHQTNKQRAAKELKEEKGKQLQIDREREEHQEQCKINLVSLTG